MNIEIKNTDFTTLGVVSTFESCKFIQGFNSKGEFEIKINSNEKQAQYLVEGKIAYFSDDKIGYIDYIRKEKQKGAANTYTIARGWELKDRLERLIYPAAGGTPDTYTAQPIETIVKSLLYKNAGVGAEEARQIPGLTIAADQARGTAVDYSAWLEDLSTEILNLLKIDGMGLNCTIDFAEAKTVFEVVSGEDKTASETTAGGVLLDIAANDLISIKDTDNKLTYKNMSVTAGPGETENREILEIGTAEMGYSRRETYTEARDALTTEDIVTTGLIKLAETLKSQSIETTYNPDGRFKLGTHFKVGDIISIKADSGIYNAQVTKVTHTYSTGVPDIKLTLGYSEAEVVMAAETARRMNTAALLAAGAIGGSGASPASICAVSAYMSANTSTANGNTLNFNTVLYDKGSNYNASTKEFTAPVDGLYTVNAQLYVQTPIDRNWYGIAAYINGSMNSESWRYASGTGFCIPSYKKDILLKTGDKLKLTARFNDTKVVFGSDQWTWFQISLKRNDG